MEGESDSMDNWRQFQGTELGSLLSSIYGQNKPKINYPKPKQNKNPLPNKDFIPGGAKLTASDPRHATRKSVPVAVPKLGKHHDEAENLKPVDLIAHRRGADVIKAQIDDIKMRQEHYRPAFTKPVSSEAEKERLRQICTYKGGKGLPEGFTLPVGTMPLELEEQKRERERLEAIRAKRGIKAPSRSVPAALSVEEQMAEQLTSEIESLRQHIEEMKSIGLKADQERRLKLQLSNKLDELSRLTR